MGPHELVASVTPELRKQDERRRRRLARKYWLRTLWSRTGYRPTMKALHRLNLCWMEPLPLRDGDNGQWINVWCTWCGVRGQRLDMKRAGLPLRAQQECVLIDGCCHTHGPCFRDGENYDECEGWPCRRGPGTPR